MALGTSVEWDIRTTGNDANGGGFDPGIASLGTDYSQQDSPQVVFTDLVIGATTTQLTSAGNPFTSAHVGNLINITSGTGFTTGWYTVTAVSSSTATMDRSVGTTASTGGHGNLGGSLATPHRALDSVSSGIAVNRNIVHIKSGTYNITTNIQLAEITLTIRGYGVTHNDGGTKPLIDATTNNINMMSQGLGSGSAYVTWIDNISFKSTSSTSNAVILTRNTELVTNCKINTTNHAILGDTGFFPAIELTCINTEITGSTRSSFPQGVIRPHGSNTFINCFIHDCNSGIITDNGGIQTNLKIYGCVFYNMGSGGFQTISTNGIAQGSTIDIINCVFKNCAYDRIETGTDLNHLVVMNCIFDEDSSESHVILKNPPWHTLYTNNAWRNLTSPTRTPTYVTVVNDIALSAAPFTNPSSNDFSLNSTTGGGAACKAAGFSGTLF